MPLREGRGVELENGWPLEMQDACLPARGLFQIARVGPTLPLRRNNPIGDSKGKCLTIPPLPRRPRSYSRARRGGRGHETKVKHYSGGLSRDASRESFSLRYYYCYCFSFSLTHLTHRSSVLLPLVISPRPRGSYLR